MPSYLQMVSGLSATKSGLLLVPLSAGILIASVGSGARVSRTGKYRWMPAAGAFLTAVSLYLLSTLTIDTELWTICLYLFVCGVGTGIGFQILIVIVQNSFPITMVGTATGAHNFFRQIGATLGSAVVGTLFASRLLGLLGERLGPYRSRLRWSRRPELPYPSECRPDVRPSEDRDRLFVQRRPRRRSTSISSR